MTQKILFTMKGLFPVASAINVACVWRCGGVAEGMGRDLSPVERVNHFPLILHGRIRAFRRGSSLNVFLPCFVKELFPPGVERFGVEPDGARSEPQMRNLPPADQGAEG
jgi:hypothetical protein